MIRIIFVCTGNICRSPMAEGILRHLWKERGHDNLIVSSMGIHGLDNQEASKLAQEVCAENGIDISGHRSRRLVIPELDSANLIFSMEQVHKEYMKLLFWQFNEKNLLLGAWPGKEGRKSNVKDPMGKSKKVYLQVYGIIYKHIERIIPYLEESFC